METGWSGPKKKEKKLKKKEKKEKKGLGVALARK